MRTIIIKSSNYIVGSQNQFSIKFPGNGVKFNKIGDKIAVASLSVYNSTFSITAQRGNITITIVWDAATPTTYTHHIHGVVFESKAIQTQQSKHAIA